MDKNQKYRKIAFYKNYFQDFFVEQNKKVKAKIVWTFDLVEDLQRVPETYLKHIENTDGLYEIRVQSGSDIFRIFCFFDQGQLVVLANGFQKKTQKTPVILPDFETISIVKTKLLNLTIQNETNKKKICC